MISGEDMSRQACRPARPAGGSNGLSRGVGLVARAVTLGCPGCLGAVVVTRNRGRLHASAVVLETTADRMTARLAVIILGSDLVSLFFRRLYFV